MMKMVPLFLVLVHPRTAITVPTQVVIGPSIDVTTGILPLRVFDFPAPDLPLDCCRRPENSRETFCRKSSEQIEAQVERQWEQLPVGHTGLHPQLQALAARDRPNSIRMVDSLLLTCTFEPSSMSSQATDFILHKKIQLVDPAVTDCNSRARPD